MYKLFLQSYYINYIDETQWATIEYLANQCPTQAGDAVFKARSLRAAQGVFNYNDVALCQTNNTQALQQAPEQTDVFINTLFEVYPNPASDNVNITYQTAETVNLALFDALGRLIKIITIEEGEGTLSIDVNNLVQGVYFCKVTNAKNAILFTNRITIIK